LRRLQTHRGLLKLRGTLQLGDGGG
jgi:hypothetical protein